MSEQQHSRRVIVIGSGPAGAAAALFLSRAGVETLVMEAGAADAPLGFTAHLGGFTVAKQKPVALRQRPDFAPVGEGRIELFEELAPGGLSNHWACAVPRFAPEDLDDARRAGEEQTWPIDYDELARWYDQVEPLLSIAAGVQDSPRLPSGRIARRWELAREWEPVVDAARKQARDVVVMPYANGASTMFTRSATAFNAFSQLIQPAERAGKLSVVYGAKALRLTWSARERRVVSVIYRDRKSGNEQELPCRAVVVAAGAVNSAQILLQSESADFPRGLGNTHGVLGRYLHDHPLGKLVFDLPQAVPIHPASYITRPALAASPPLLAAACMQWCGAPALARSVLKGRPGRDTQIGFSVFGSMVPSREDFVALDPAHKGKDGQPQLQIRLRHPPDAIETLERTRREVSAILEQAGWEPRLAAWTIEAPGDSVHYGGTCRMHASPRFGVVDARCRVHDVPNVAVADSAVFTTTPEKNPVLTAMALAARAGALFGARAAGRRRVTLRSTVRAARRRARTRAP